MRAGIGLAVGCRRDALGVPTISRFYRIVIRMYLADHAPPHFHAVYAGGYRDRDGRDPALHQAGEHSPTELGDLFGVGRSTIYRAIQRDARRRELGAAAGSATARAAMTARRR